jgi:hypothetical protein
MVQNMSHTKERHASNDDGRDAFQYLALWSDAFPW